MPTWSPRWDFLCLFFRRQIRSSSKRCWGSGGYRRRFMLRIASGGDGCEMSRILSRVYSGPQPVLAVIGRSTSVPHAPCADERTCPVRSSLTAPLSDEAVCQTHRLNESLLETTAGLPDRVPVGRGGRRGTSGSKFVADCGLSGKGSWGEGRLDRNGCRDDAPAIAPGLGLGRKKHRRKDGFLQAG